MDAERTDPHAWLSHIAGIASLLKARGPQLHNLPLPRAAFEHCRYNLVSSTPGIRLAPANLWQMLYCIFKRKSFGFADPAWLNEPWIGVEKEITQRVVDQGLKLAAIVERSDEYAQSMAGMTDLRQLVRECDVTTSQVEMLKQELIAEEETGKRFNAESDDSPRELADENMSNCLLLRLTATTIELLLNEAAQDVLQQARRRKRYSMQSTDDERYQFAVEVRSVELMVPHKSRLFDLARELVEGSYDLHGRVTIVARLLFPLHAAVRHLPPSSPLSDKCIALMEQLQGRKGALPHRKLDEKDFTFLAHARQKAMVALGALQGQGGKGQPG